MLEFIKNIPLEWIWIALFIIFVVVELASVGLLTIWFAAGSLVALALAFIDVSFTIQLVAFFVVSIALLFLTRPILKKYIYKNKEAMKTNVNSVIGKKAIITKKITEHDFGELKVDGQVWSAISENNEEIEIGSNVEIVAVKGVKLIVKELKT